MVLFYPLLRILAPDGLGDLIQLRCVAIETCHGYVDMCVKRMNECDTRWRHFVCYRFQCGHYLVWLVRVRELLRLVFWLGLGLWLRLVSCLGQIRVMVR